MSEILICGILWVVSILWNFVIDWWAKNQTSMVRLGKIFRILGRCEIIAASILLDYSVFNYIRR